MSWGTPSQFVGVLGVMNTMLMTVFERTHEICVLLAVGWKRGRIMRMIFTSLRCSSSLAALSERRSVHRRAGAKGAGDSRIVAA
jgi:putative ABC transport system permease protein